MSTSKQELIITIKIDLEGDIRAVGRANMRSHIKNALCLWGRQFHPDDVLFNCIQNVRVGKINVKKTK